jgi:predicted Rossmann fold flavoprotein
MAIVIVIGAGAAGMMAALSAAESKDNKVYLLERNEKLGKKLFITGKGRCNITNNKDISEYFEYIPGNPHFLYSALYSYTNIDTINFFEGLGVKLKVERGDRVFPESDKSSDIINGFSTELRNKGVKVLLNSRVKDLQVINDEIQGIILSDNTVLKGDYFILCTGGLSYPLTGSTGDGYVFAKKLGHTIIKPLPSLVPIVVKDTWISELQGLSLKNVELRIKESNGKILFKDFGEMIFTHFGISGPIVLSSSRVVNSKNNLSAVIDLKPALTFEELDKRIQRDFNKYINKDFKNSLNELLPQKLIEIIIKLSGIDENKKVNMITKEERKILIDLMKNLELHIQGLRPIEEAIITAGGIDTKEIDPSTMRSKIYPNLFFAGELVDVDAVTGGFNLQIAISTGYLAGKSTAEPN